MTYIFEKTPLQQWSLCFWIYYLLFLGCLQIKLLSNVQTNKNLNL